MGKEIERKFLVNPKIWERAVKPEGTYYRQGYILAEPGKTVRVRVSGNAGFLTIKGAAEGISRDEYEYEIPLNDAKEMLDKLCGSEVVKKRYKIYCGGKLWEVDVFDGDNYGLILAEIELKSEEEMFDIPSWIEKEVTGDIKYNNSYLSLCPFERWK